MARAGASRGGGGGGRQSSQQISNANEQEIRMRDSEIGKVAKSVQEIATLMQDLSALVIDQVRRPPPSPCVHASGE